MDCAADLRRVIERTVLIVRIIVTCVEVAADTLEVQLLLILFVVEMSCDAVVRDTLREEVDMA